jgi:hypothetical protein
LPRRLYYFITLVGHVSERSSLTSLLVTLRSRSQDRLALVDYDEVKRRIVIRFAPSELGFIKTIVQQYMDAASFEVKARGRLRIDPKKVRDLGGVVERTPKGLLAVVPCDNGIALVEHRGRDVLVKYCVKPVVQTRILPTLIPPSMCSFDPFSTDPMRVYEAARQCFDRLQALTVGVKEG